MTPLLALNMAINLIVAIALWLVWQRDRTQAFARYLSLAGMVALAGPVAYIAWRQDQLLWHALGAVVLVAFNTGYLTLLMYGVSHLASRPFSRPVLLALAGALAALDAVLLAFDTQTMQSATATLSTGIGVLALIWLWPQGRSERLTGMLLVLLGLSQFTFVMLGDVGIAAQAAVTSTLRVCLGFTLVYAAVSRSTARSDRLHERYAQMTENSHQGVAVIRGDEVLYANPALLRIYGAASIDQFGYGAVTIPETERPLMRERHRRLMSGQTEREDWEGLRFRMDGSPMRLRFSGWRIDWDGSPAEQVIISDDTKVHDATQALLYSATHDELTGLPNRSALLQRLRELCRQDGTAGYALLLLDIDRFKLFNDAHGHTLGDEVLKALARRLVEIMAPQAEVMRLGEDEFALLAPHAGSEISARAVANQVLALLAHPLTLAQREFFIDASMGIALFPLDAREPELLLRAATAAMHEAKRTPGRSLAFAEARFERGSSEVLEQEQALRAGIANEEFSLVYEPKVDAHTGRLVGLEALARWNRPGMGAVSPLHFIPAAERTGLIGALGKLILNLACRQIAAWRSTYGEVVPVAVNVSPVQLLDPDFPALVEHTLHRFDLPAQLLTLEITETAAVAHLDEARAQIRQMRELGVEVALDDFGTGFSSLSMLRSLPLRSVKIDRSLIDPLPAPDATAVVHAICTLAGVLGLEVVAEGVEREDHAAAARAAGCQLLQGFLFSRPMPPDTAGQWLRERRVGSATATSLSASLQ